MRLITGSADQTVKLWNVQTGAQLYSFNFDSPARAVDFSVGDKLAVISTDPFMGLPSTIQVKCIANDPSERMSANFFSLVPVFMLGLLIHDFSSCLEDCSLCLVFYIS